MRRISQKVIIPNTLTTTTTTETMIVVGISSRCVLEAHDVCPDLPPVEAHWAQSPNKRGQYKRTLEEVKGKALTSIGCNRAVSATMETYGNRTNIITLDSKHYVCQRLLSSPEGHGVSQ